MTRYLELIKKYDFSFMLLLSSIFMVGILNLYSATHAEPVPEIAKLYQVQIFWFLVSLMVLLVVGFIHPKTWHRYAYLIYIVNCILLFLVIVMGKTVMGAKRWLVLGPIRFQPSEMMKISLVLALGRWYAKVNPYDEVGIKEMIIPFIITMLPAFMVIIQPDLGTGILILLVFLTITFYRRLKFKTILLVILLGTLSSSLMYKYGLKEYQRQRIHVFLDPWGDAQGTGYNAIQSEIAIGSGQLFGKGYKKSSQASLSFLPENHTDFVFSVYNEEHGLFGSLFLIILYVILFLRFIWLATSVLSLFDAIVCIGVLSIFFWHTFVNMGMVTGVLPIVGLPLPLMSYGGSSLLTFGFCCGLVTAISNTKNMF